MSRFFSGPRLVILVGVAMFAFFIVLPALFIFAQIAIVKPYQQSSGSMQPALELRDRVIANRIIYRFAAIERGDVIVFDPPPSVGQRAPYVKRVIGLPGDTVEIRDGKVLVNGEELVVAGASRPTYTKASQLVPPGKLFVLGDNRNESADSHIWGFITEDDVIGRIDLIYWPPANLHFLH